MSKSHIITPVGRLAFTQNLTKKGEKGKFSAAILFEKGTDLSGLKTMIKEVADANSINLKVSKANPLKVYDYEAAANPAEYAKDKVVLNFNTQFAYGVVDSEGNEVFEGDLKAGDKIQVAVSAYPWTFNKTKGIGINFVAIKLVEACDEDEQFYSKPNVSSYFGDTSKPVAKKVVVEEAEEAGKDDFEGF